MPDALPQTWRERAALAPGVLEALLARTAAVHDASLTTEHVFVRADGDGEP